jgi:hypothetical protein
MNSRKNWDRSGACMRPIKRYIKYLIRETEEKA